MSYADFVYGTLAYSVFDTGSVEENARTGVSTRRCFGKTVKLDPAFGGIPVLESKKLYWKTAIDELIWIFIKGSSNIRDMKHPKIWEKWADENGSIGKSYGYQAGKKMKFTFKGQKYSCRNQLEYVVKLLSLDPSNRQALIVLWDCEELNEMGLPPCVMTYVFTIIDGKLNLLVLQRSADLAVGVPFDFFEAGVLQALVVHELNRMGVEVTVGELMFTFGDVHIYSMHEEELKKQIEFINQQQGETLRPKPSLKIANKSIFDMTADDIELVDYIPGPERSFDLVK